MIHFQNMVNIISRDVIFSFGSFFILFSLLYSNAYAYTLGTPNWVEKPVFIGYAIQPESCWYEGDNGPFCDGYTPCVKVIFDAFTNFGAGVPGGELFSDDKCTFSKKLPDTGPNNWYETISKTKQAECSVAEVMTGIRFQEFSKEIDQEHQDAKCVPISGVTLGSSRWVTPTNALAKLNPGYKIATCNTDEVMTGLKMYGMQKEVDEEHVIAKCTKILTGVSPGGTYYWKEAPNAYTTLYGGYKDASCNAGDIMVGTRWAESAIEVDQEHTDAYCYSPPPSVKVWFSVILKKIINFI